MANLPELSEWVAGIYQLETTDPVLGGPDGIDNLQAKQLANRTLFLKGLVDALGTDKQPLDATLTALAGVVTAANQLIYATGPDAFATSALSAFARTLLDDADAATARGTLGAQAADATLTALAGVVTAANQLIYATGADTFATTSLSAFIRTLLDDADAATARTTLGIGSVATLTSDVDGTLATNSDTRVPTQKAVKTYVDGLIAAQDAMVFEGVIDCSANPSYPAADRGHTYRVSVAGKIGGAAGLNVEAGDILICTTDGTASGTHATVGANWGVIQANLDGALLTTAIGVTVQGYDATLAALAGVVTAANQLIYATGADTFATTALSAFIRTLLDDADAATARTTLGAAPLASPVFTGTPAVPTAAAGTNTTQAASTAFVQQEVGSANFGSGQTWQDVSASRTLGTTYTNTTGKPIAISFVPVASASKTHSLTVNGSVIASLAYGSATLKAQLFGIVPPGATYKVDSTSTIETWMELRA